MKNEIIKIENGNKIFNKKRNIKVFENLSFNVYANDFIGIYGDSGNGKTTLINIIGLLDNLSTGSYYLFNDIDTKKLSDFNKAYYRNRLFGYIFQEYSLIEDYTVLENILLPTKYNKNSSKKDSIINAKKLLCNFGIEEKENEVVANLSGGQRQRVAIARALINHPKIIIADEPTSALDKENKKYVLDTLKLINESGVTIILVTHDEASTIYCNRLFKMEKNNFYEVIK
ncbi:MAG: ABC transporter ATP-binding protein [Bacilli bacterium]|jgi:putative ABC transport system ATP-binding protein|nr:ABC transporter ATP-binding protein [Bacilli bacterium]